jgi:hypothetical protein
VRKKDEERRKRIIRERHEGGDAEDLNVSRVNARFAREKAVLLV